MKFTFENLGTIKKTTLDLRPLTVIIGPNNTSKTYLAYCVHGLIANCAGMGSIGWKAQVDWKKPEVNTLVSMVDEVLGEVGADLAGNLTEYFQDTRGHLFTNSRVSWQVDTDDIVSALKRIGYEFDSSNAPVAPKALADFNDSASLVVRVLDELFLPPITLPAERNALIITYKMLSTRRYRVLRDRARQLRHRLASPEKRQAAERQAALLREQGDVRYPQPVEDFLDFLTDVELASTRIKNPPNSPFGKLASAIEEHIQGGHRTSFEPTALGGSELALTIGDGARIDLYNASSSIKQLAPLLLYLRYRAEEGQTLIVDEPEMNLHPEGQAKLLEALGMLANLGVRVLLTTHSPYFMSHLNSLVAADVSSVARKRRQAQHLYTQDANAFLAPDQVSAYEMREEGLVSLADPDYGIRWDTLSDVSSEIQRRYFSIMEEPKTVRRRGQAK
ncbi:MAG: ATP-binding protein [Polyangiaceae bacterium]|nr:ATP-binding protein [Polyangiaceae bacterium]